MKFIDCVLITFIIIKTNHHKRFSNNSGLVSHESLFRLRFNNILWYMIANRISQSTILTRKKNEKGETYTKKKLKSLDWKEVFQNEKNMKNLDAAFPRRRKPRRKRKGGKSYWINLDWKYGAFSEINFMNLLKSLLVPLSIDPQRCSDYQKP